MRSKSQNVLENARLCVTFEKKKNESKTSGVLDSFRIHVKFIQDSCGFGQNPQDSCETSVTFGVFFPNVTHSRAFVSCGYVAVRLFHVAMLESRLQM